MSFNNMAWRLIVTGSFIWTPKAAKALPYSMFRASELSFGSGNPTFTDASGMELDPVMDLYAFNLWYQLQAWNKHVSSLKFGPIPMSNEELLSIRNNIMRALMFLNTEEFNYMGSYLAGTLASITFGVIVGWGAITPDFSTIILNETNRETFSSDVARVIEVIAHEGYHYMNRSTDESAATTFGLHASCEFSGTLPDDRGFYNIIASNYNHIRNEGLGAEFNWGSNRSWKFAYEGALMYYYNDQPSYNPWVPPRRWLKNR